MASSQRQLLDTDVVPKSYTIHLTPDLVNTFTFEGTEVVHVTVAKSTSHLTIHSLDILVHSASFKAHDGSSIAVQETTYDKKKETCSFVFASALPVGAGELHVSFRGELNDALAGFYRSKYQVNGESRYMATTQFEPTDARRAFPCWDEPALKATFSISLTIPKQLLALGNMPIISEVASGELKTLTFDVTPIMSTYLLAFIVSEFDYVEDTTVEGVKVRVYTPLGKKEQGKFALACATKVLSYYSDYFEIAYPLPKLDMVAIPDFAAGAMENWGLVTYRETALLVDPERASVPTKQRVAYVVAHELAHQWFGNLVTMEWWKELWLNEGFATFVGNQAVDYLFKEWDVWTQFVSDYAFTAMLLDGMESSHAIEVEVCSSDQVNEIFDQISYNKGASVIRMVSSYMGEEKFRRGLAIYLKRFQYKNAVTTDLWDALAESSGLPVRDFMNAWTTTVGYPLVSVREEADGVFHFEQERFLYSGKTGGDQVWFTHIEIVSDSGARASVDLKDKSLSVSLPQLAGAKWIQLNPGQAGFFRTSYSATQLGKLSTAVASLPAVDRVALQSDIFAAVRAGRTPTHEFLSLMSGFRDETEYTVLADLLGNVGSIADTWASEPNVEGLRSHVRSLIAPLAQRLTWSKQDGESDLTTLSRSLVLFHLSCFGHADTIKEVRRRFELFLADEQSLPADLRGLVFSGAVQYGSKQEYDSLMAYYHRAEMNEEKVRALRGLGNARDPAVVLSTLEWALESVRSQDLPSVFQSTASFPEGRDLTWKFFQDKRARLEELLGDAKMVLIRIVTASCNGFTTAQRADEVEAYFAAQPFPAAEMNIKQCVEKIRLRAAWLERDRASVAAWLSANTVVA